MIERETWQSVDNAAKIRAELVSALTRLETIIEEYESVNDFMENSILDVDTVRYAAESLKEESKTFAMSILYTSMLRRSIVQLYVAIAACDIYTRSGSFEQFTTFKTATFRACVTIARLYTAYDIVYEIIGGFSKDLTNIYNQLHNVTVNLGYPTRAIHR